MKKYVILLVALVFVNTRTRAQQGSTLDTLAGYTFQISYSKGFADRARYIADLVKSATGYYGRMLNFRPTIKLAVLNAADWKVLVTNGAVYGMPHYKDKEKTLVVAATDNTFWKSFVPPSDQLSPDLSAQLTTVYKTSDGSVSMQAFFDLLAIHELGHAFQSQAGIKMQRNWMSELYVNILLHTYIAGDRPALLPALTLFPKMVVSSGTKEFIYTSLNDAENHYNELGSKYPRNYGWYQCRWHATAGVIYDRSGSAAAKKMWNAFKNQKGRLTDQELMELLEATDAAVADMVKNWDINTLDK
jgi:hypothetical protein